MKYLTKITIVLGIALAMCSCKQKTENQGTTKQPTLTTLSVEDFEKRIADKENTVLVDVRTPKEFSEGHIAGAMNIDVKEDKFRSECVKQLPKDKTILVYCRSGFRSQSAGHILNEEGFDVIDLKGGFNAWKDAGKEYAK